MFPHSYLQIARLNMLRIEWAPRPQYLSSIPLEILPLSLCGLLVKALPPVKRISARPQDTTEIGDLRLALDDGVDQLQLSLSNLDDLLNETGSDLVLEFLNPVMNL